MAFAHLTTLKVLMRLMTETGYWIAGQTKTKTGRIMLTVIYNPPPFSLAFYKGMFPHLQTNANTM